MSILLDAFKLKPLQAMLFFRKKGYAWSWSWMDVWKEQHAQSFTVAKCMKADVLQDIRGMCDKALNEGISFQQFKKELMPRLQAQGWWGKKEITDPETGDTTEIQLGSTRRLQTIYQTNLQTSYMAGRYKSQMDADSEYLQYISVIDGQTTDRCRGLHLKVFLATDPIWDYLYPPNHWGCRARVRSLTAAKFKRENIISESIDKDGNIVRKMGQLKLSSSEGRLTKRIKTVNGQPIEVTGYEMDNGGIYLPDPGWDYNPGKTAFKPDLNKYDPDIKRQLETDLNL